MPASLELEGNVVQNLTPPIARRVGFRDTLQSKHQNSTRKLAWRCKYRPASDINKQQIAM